jgi:hypothetical protein
MTHSLKYIGITRDALIDAAKYDPPSAEIVTALVEALESDDDEKAIEALEAELDDMANEVDRLREEIYSLEAEAIALEEEIDMLKTDLAIQEFETNQETESND